MRIMPNLYLIELLYYNISSVLIIYITIFNQFSHGHHSTL